MMQFTLPEIWKWHAIWDHAGSSNTKISECLRVSLGTTYRIRKELDGSNGDYEGKAAQKTHFNHSE